MGRQELLCSAGPGLIAQYLKSAQYCLFTIYNVHNAAPRRAARAGRGQPSIYHHRVPVLMAGKCKFIRGAGAETHQALIMMAGAGYPTWSAPLFIFEQRPNVSRMVRDGCGLVGHKTGSGWLVGLVTHMVGWSVTPEVSPSSRPE